MTDGMDRYGKQGRSSSSAGRGSSKAGTVEYTRVVPKFLRHLVNSDANHYDTFKPLPSSSRTAKEREERLKNGGIPSSIELDELRSEGFLVDVPVESTADTHQCSSYPFEASIAKVEVGNAKPVHGKSSLPPRPSEQKNTLKIAAPKIAKDVNKRKTRAEFATKNRNKLSFSTDSDEDSNSDEN